CLAVGGHVNGAVDIEVVHRHHVREPVFVQRGERGLEVLVQELFPLLAIEFDQALSARHRLFLSKIRPCGKHRVRVRYVHSISSEASPRNWNESTNSNCSVNLRALANTGTSCWSEVVASILASAAPRQKWMPKPKAMCGTSFLRSILKTAASLPNAVSSRFAEPSSTVTIASLGIAVPPIFTGAVARRNR